MGRLGAIISAKWNMLLGRAENTEEMLDLAYEKQVDTLFDVRTGIAAVTTAKKRIQRMLDERGKAITKLTEQAESAVAQGKEDLARVALGRREQLRGEIQDLSEQYDEISARETTLLANERQLSAKIDSFRTDKEVMKARYQSAEAMVQIGELQTGLGKNMASTGRMLQRAEDNIEQMDARGAALFELAETGAFEDDGKRIDRELAQISEGDAVEKELEAIKQKQLEAAPTS